MTTLQKVYMVTDGSYSDYHIIGVYSTKALAERVKELHNAYNEVEELELDDVPDSPPGLLGWRVDMLENGDVRHTGRVGLIKQAGFTYCYKGYRQKEPHAMFEVYAREAEHAVKIASEIRREMIVSGKWAQVFQDARTLAIKNKWHGH